MFDRSISFFDSLLSGRTTEGRGFIVTGRLKSRVWNDFSHRHLTPCGQKCLTQPLGFTLSLTSKRCQYFWQSGRRTVHPRFLNVTFFISVFRRSSLRHGTPVREGRPTRTECVTISVFVQFSFYTPPFWEDCRDLTQVTDHRIGRGRFTTQQRHLFSGLVPRPVLEPPGRRVSRRRGPTLQRSPRFRCIDSPVSHGSWQFPRLDRSPSSTPDR